MYTYIKYTNDKEMNVNIYILVVFRDKYLRFALFKTLCLSTVFAVWISFRAVLI